MAEILICGAGQLGSRYLQGLSLTSSVHNITVVDPSVEALEVANDRYKEVSSTKKDSLKFTDDISLIPKYLDLAIIASTSFPRAKIVSEISLLCDVKFWILEKILAPSPEELDQILISINSSQGAWVNHWMRTTPWAFGLKSWLQNKNLKNVNFKVDGGAWGLACNSTHFLDLMLMVSGEPLNEILTDRLNSNWVPGKRKGYFEIFGEMEAIFKNQSRIILDCNNSNDLLRLTVSYDDSRYVVKFDADNNLIAVKVNGKSEKFDFPYQSKMTAKLVDSILFDSNCNLTTCLDAVKTHKPFITALTKHWNNNHSNKIARLPIT